jgi:hypothetical protein
MKVLEKTTPLLKKEYVSGLNVFKRKPLFPRAAFV